MGCPTIGSDLIFTMYPPILGFPTIQAQEFTSPCPAQEVGAKRG